MRRLPKNNDAELMRFDELDEIDGSIWRREGAHLAYLASLVPEGQVIAEIGAYKGRSTCYLAKGSKAGNGVPVHTVDLWDDGGQTNSAYVQYDAPGVFEEFQAALGSARVKSMVTPHRGWSTEVAGTWPEGREIGLLFQDADHSAEGVMADLTEWATHLAAGATIAVHNYEKRFPGVMETVDAFVEATGAEAYRFCRLAVIKLPETAEQPDEVEEQPDEDDES